MAAGLKEREEELIKERDRVVDVATKLDHCEVLCKLVENRGPAK